MNVVKDVVKNCPKDFPKELSDRQRIILKIIKGDNTTTSQKIAQKISQKKPVSERTIKSDLAALHEMGILFREGGRKNGYWVIKK